VVFVFKDKWSIIHNICKEVESRIFKYIVLISKLLSLLLAGVSHTLYEHRTLSREDYTLCLYALSLQQTNITVIDGISSLRFFYWVSCCSIFSFLCNVLEIIVCLCIFCPSSIYSFWLFLWNLQTFANVTCVQYCSYCNNKAKSTNNKPGISWLSEKNMDEICECHKNKGT